MSDDDGRIYTQVGEETVDHMDVSADQIAWAYPIVSGKGSEIRIAPRCERDEINHSNTDRSVESQAANPRFKQEDIQALDQESRL